MLETLATIFFIPIVVISGTITAILLLLLICALFSALFK